MNPQNQANPDAPASPTPPADQPQPPSASQPQVIQADFSSTPAGPQMPIAVNPTVAPPSFDTASGGKLTTGKRKRVMVVAIAILLVGLIAGGVLFVTKSTLLSGGTCNNKDATNTDPKKPTPAQCDEDRRQDLTALRGALESFYLGKGAYPSLEEINDKAFFTQNFPTLNRDGIHDPLKTDFKLVAEEKEGFYQYATTPAGCNNKDKVCLKYTLRAKMQTKEPLVYQSIN